MESGNSWVPLNKGLRAFLPKDKRPFTKLEASFSLQLDYDEETGATVSGYASLWGWNRKKVLKFLDDAGVSIIGSERGSHKGGMIKPQGHEGLHERDMRGTSQGHLKLIDNKHLENKKDMRGTSQGHERDMRGVTTIKTKTKNKNITPIAPLKGGGEKFDPVAFCVSLGANEQDAIDWVTWRKKGKWKKETTKRVINYLKGRAEKSNISFAMAVNICADRQWLCLTDDFKPTEQESTFAGGWK